MEDLKPHRNAGRSRLVLGLFLLALGGVMLAVNLGYEIPLGWWRYFPVPRSEEHTSELQSPK